MVTSAWPAGLVPLFATQTPEGFDLRRLPPRGQENLSDPLFFALPPEDETNAASIAGHWHALASNSQRDNHSPDWQLAIDGERVAGRFDPLGEYRVAFITGGLFRSNRLRLEIEYINDHYILEGQWRTGTLAGTWRNLEGEPPERGIWSASRSAPNLSWPVSNAVPLFRWTRERERVFSTSTHLEASGWRRDPRPLGRVWPAGVASPADSKR